jgi:micrococcal nuclease
MGETPTIARLSHPSSLQQIILQIHGKDEYGRTLADVLLMDGTNVNHALVKQGWCWWYQKYAPGDLHSRR